MMIENVFPRVLFEFNIATLTISITDTVVTSWIIIALLALLSYAMSRRLSILHPSKMQLFAEKIVIAIKEMLETSTTVPPWTLVPLIGTIWIYIGFMNLISIIPYFHNPTRDLSTTASLSLISFFSIHYYGIKFNGLGGYLKRYIEPSVLMLPFNLFADISRIFAMAIRLFGNMLSWEMIIAILIALVGFLVPVPMMLLGIVGDILHAFLFGFLTYIFIIGGIEAEKPKSTKESQNG